MRCANIAYMKQARTRGLPRNRRDAGLQHEAMKYAVYKWTFQSHACAAGHTGRALNRTGYVVAAVGKGAGYSPCRRRQPSFREILRTTTMNDPTQGRIGSDHIYSGSECNGDASVFLAGIHVVEPCMRLVYEPNCLRRGLSDRACKRIGTVHRQRQRTESPSSILLVG